VDARACRGGEKDEEGADGEVERQSRRGSAARPLQAPAVGRVRLAVARGRRLPGEDDLFSLGLAAVEADAEAGRGEPVGVVGEEAGQW
jgi:hypothetical protein